MTVNGTTVLIAGIGVVGTLLAPLAGERLRRKSSREDRLMAARIEVYAELLEVTARVADNATTWSSIPLADLPEPDDATLDRVLARVRTVGSKDVRVVAEAFVREAQQFTRGLWDARQLHARARDAGEVDSPGTILSRLAIGEVADQMRKIFTQLEEAIHRDLR